MLSFGIEDGLLIQAHEAPGTEVSGPLEEPSPALGTAVQFSSSSFRILLPDPSSGILVPKGRNHESHVCRSQISEPTKGLL